MCRIYLTILSCLLTGALCAQGYVFNDKSELVAGVNAWVANPITAAATYGNISTWDVRLVPDMSNLFQSKTQFNDNINSWDVSSVTDMDGMFRLATSFNQPLSTWNVSSVTNMQSMFNVASSFNQDLSSWIVGSVTEVSFMFYGATSFNQDLSSWSVGSVTDMDGMFYGASLFNQDLSSWTVGNVTDMSYMLNNSGISTANYDAFLTALSDQVVKEDVNLGASGLTYCGGEAARQSLENDDGWNINDDGRESFVTCPYVFADKAELVAGVNAWVANPITAAATYGNISTWDVSLVTDMSHLFLNKTQFNDNINSWNVSSVTNMDGMFGYATSFNQPLSTWIVSNVTKVSYMFYGATSFNQDLSSWSVGSVTEVSYMFYGATSFNQDLSSWIVGSVTDMDGMFYGATSFNQPLSTWNVSSVTIMQYMFYGASLFNQDLSSWTVGNVTDMSYMLNNSGISTANYDAFLTALSDQVVKEDVNLGASGLTYCGGEAARQSLENDDGWNINDDGRESFVTCPYVFADKAELVAGVNAWVANPITAAATYGNISTWDVSLVTDMSNLFLNKTQFNDNINSWDVSSVTSMSYMFLNASSFNQPLNSWTVSSVTDMPGMFTNAIVFNQPLNSWNVMSVTSMNGMFYNAPLFNQDLNSWTVGNVTNMQYMFREATSFNQDLSSWIVGSVTDMSFMFYGAPLFNQPLNSWDVSSVTSMDGMFDGSDISKVNYDALLIGWSTQEVKEGVNLGASGRTYCLGAAERFILTSAPNNWTITDGGENCAPPLTIYDFMTREQEGLNLHATEYIPLAIAHLNTLTGVAPPVTTMDFLKGEVVNNKVFMEFNLQAIVDAINAAND